MPASKFSFWGLFHILFLALTKWENILEKNIICCKNTRPWGMDQQVFSEEGHTDSVDQAVSVASNYLCRWSIEATTDEILMSNYW